MRLRSALLRGPARWRRPAATDPAPHRAFSGAYPISAAGVASGRGHPGRGELAVRCGRSRGQHIVELSGALSVRTRAPLADALENALEDDLSPIVLDLRNLESIDHAGLDTILTAHLRASDEQKLLVIVPGPPPVQRVLDAAQGPFLYTSGQGNRAAGPNRSRGRRARLSPRPDRQGAPRHSLRRFG